MGTPPDPNSQIPISELLGDFQIASLYPFQQAVIDAWSNNKDVFLVSPTSSGKSLCFQLPSLVLPGLTVVITPLKSLILDQLTNLKNHPSLSVDYLSSDKTYAENQETLSRINSLNMLYLTPERLFQLEELSTQHPSTKLTKTTHQKLSDTAKILQTLCKPQKIRFVVDEAQCILEWGDSFRPSYESLSQLKVVFPNAPIMCISACMTRHNIDTIISLLKFDQKNMVTVSMPINRPNLIPNIQFLKSRKTQEYLILQTISDLKSRYLDVKQENQSNPPKSKSSNLSIQPPPQHKHPFRVILYVRKRSDTESLSSKINNIALAKPYHAGLSPQERNLVYSQFKSGEINIIVATIAFGLGINIPSVHSVIIGFIPKNISTLYQLWGRAGRISNTSKQSLLPTSNKSITNSHYFPVYLFATSTILLSSAAFCQNSAQLAEFSSICYMIFSNVCRRRFFLSSLSYNPKEQILCDPPCDVCVAKMTTKYREHDYSIELRELITASSSISQISKQISFSRLISFLQGKIEHFKVEKRAQIRSLPGFGKCANWKTTPALKTLFVRLFFCYLIRCFPSRYDTTRAYEKYDIQNRGDGLFDISRVYLLINKTTSFGILAKSDSTSVVFCEPDPTFKVSSTPTEPEHSDNSIDLDSVEDSEEEMEDSRPPIPIGSSKFESSPRLSKFQKIKKPTKNIKTVAHIPDHPDGNLLNDIPTAHDMFLAHFNQHFPSTFGTDKHSQHSKSQHKSKSQSRSKYNNIVPLSNNFHNNNEDIANDSSKPSLRSSQQKPKSKHAHKPKTSRNQNVRHFYQMNTFTPVDNDPSQVSAKHHRMKKARSKRMRSRSRSRSVGVISQSQGTSTNPTNRQNLVPGLPHGPMTQISMSPEPNSQTTSPKHVPVHVAAPNENTPTVGNIGTTSSQDAADNENENIEETSPSYPSHLLLRRYLKWRYDVAIKLKLNPGDIFTTLSAAMLVDYFTKKTTRPTIGEFGSKMKSLMSINVFNQIRQDIPPLYEYSIQIISS